MADENANPGKTLTIKEIEFPVSWPYAEGHTITAAEAKALNQVRKENLSNNFRKLVDEHLEKGTPTLEELQTQFAELDASYQFTLSNVGGGRRVLDPLERECRSLARDYIKQELAKAGRKLSDVPQGMTKDEWDDHLETLTEQVAADEQIVTMAKGILKAKQKSAGIQLGSLNLAGGGTEQAA